jgi:hypothetical protein
MRDFHFWLGLPYILQGSLPELRSNTFSLKQELEVFIKKSFSFQGKSVNFFKIFKKGIGKTHPRHEKSNNRHDYKLEIQDLARRR